MQPEERLDALLSRHLRDGVRDDTADELVDSTGELIPLLDAAERLIVRDSAEPSSTFADQLESALLSRFATPSADATAMGNTQREAPEELSHPSPAGGTTPPATPTPLSSITARTRRSDGGKRSLQPVSAQQAWSAVAALLLVSIGIFGGLVAAARSGHLWLGPLQQAIATETPLPGEGDGVRAHLQQAQSALVAFNQAVNQKQGDQAYQAAISRFADEETKASADLSRLPPDTTRAALAAQLTALRERGRQDLRAALLVVSWPVRALATNVLDQLGDTVPKIGQTTIAGAVGHDSYVWTITAQGSGFAPGAVLLVDGQPAGVTISVSATTFVAQVSSAAIQDGEHHIGVGNPDGTAVNGAALTFSRPDDHGGHGGSNSTSG